MHKNKQENFEIWLFWIEFAIITLALSLPLSTSCLTKKNTQYRSHAEMREERGQSGVNKKWWDHSRRKQSREKEWVLPCIQTAMWIIFQLKLIWSISLSHTKCENAAKVLHPNILLSVTWSTRRCDWIYIKCSESDF